MSAKLFFPKFLDKGSQGPPVLVLQLLLLASEKAPEGLVPDSVYGAMTAKGVENLQEELRMLGNTEVEIDGNFGPTTRAAYFKESGIDVNAFTKAMFTEETKAVQPKEAAAS